MCKRSNKFYFKFKILLGYFLYFLDFCVYFKIILVNCGVFKSICIICVI